MAPRQLPTIHQRGGGPRLDAVLELVAFTARPRPLSLSLDELPRRIAQVFTADVCSIYLLEGDDLVMRGNVGFSSTALGEVRLAVGQGITGLAVEYMRPMSIDAAPTHESYRHFPLLGEERFPIFLAMPIAGPSGALGALVLQRREPPPFDHAEIELAAALTAPIAAVAERAKLVDALSDKKAATSSGRRVTLPGRSVVPGRGLGVLRPLPRPISRPVAPRESVKEQGRALDQAIGAAKRTLDSFAERAQRLGAAEARVFTHLGTMLEDARLRERALEYLGEKKGLAHALSQVSGEAIRNADRTGDVFGIDRARGIAEVCEALALLSQPEAGRDLLRGAVLMGDQFTVLDLLSCARWRPSGIALAEPASDHGRALLALLDVPAVAELASLFRWTAEGELALVDADHGMIRVNPSRAEISAFRISAARGAS